MSSGRAGGSFGQRLASVRGAFPAGDFPPISVFDIGGSYFVSDGHKRVAAARQMRMASIDAEVIRLEPDTSFPPMGTYAS